VEKLYKNCNYIKFKTKTIITTTLWRPQLPRWCQGWASECPENYKWRLKPVWHRMLYSCTDVATVDVKGFSIISTAAAQWVKSWATYCMPREERSLSHHRWLHSWLRRTRTWLCDRRFS